MLSSLELHSVFENRLVYDVMWIGMSMRSCLLGCAFYH